jgi:hypothetical protein
MASRVTKNGCDSHTIIIRKASITSWAWPIARDSLLGDDYSKSTCIYIQANSDELFFSFRFLASRLGRSHKYSYFPSIHTYNDCGSLLNNNNNALGRLQPGPLDRIVTVEEAAIVLSMIFKNIQDSFSITAYACAVIHCPMDTPLFI